MNNTIQLISCNNKFLDIPKVEEQKIDFIKCSFLDGICHSNNRIYGIPYTSKFIMEIFPDDKFTMNLHRIPILLEAGDEEGQSEASFSKSISNNLEISGVNTKTDDLQIQTEHSYFYSELAKNLNKENRIKLKLGFIFHCPNSVAIKQSNRWSKGISYAEVFFCLPFDEPIALMCKPMGHFLEFTAVGSPLKNVLTGIDSQFLDTELNAIAKDEIVSLGDEFFMSYSNNPRTDWKINGNEKYLDYILSKKDMCIYGASWNYETSKHHHNINLLPEKSLEIPRVFRMELPITSDLSFRYLGTFHETEKFCGAIEHLGKIYTVPENESSILEITPGVIPKLKYIGYFDQDITGMSTIRKFSKVIKIPEGLFFVPYNSDRFIILYDTGNLESIVEPIIGIQKFKSAVYSEKLNSIILAPYDYPFLLMYNIQNKTLTSLYSFLNKGGEQYEKYSDIVMLDPDNFFCIPYRRKNILHINIKSINDIRVNEFKINSGFYLQGINLGHKIYCIPFHGNNVMTIELNKLDIDTELDKELELRKNKKILSLSKFNIDTETLNKEMIQLEKENKDKIIYELFDNNIIINEYQVYNDNIKHKFSKSILFNGNIYCIPFNNPSILIIKIDNDKPKFKKIKLVLKEIPGLFDHEGKFSSACLFHNELFLIPYNFNFILKLNQVDGIEKIEQEIMSTSNKKSAKYCDGIAIDDQLYLIPKTADKILKITNKNNS